MRVLKSEISTVPSLFISAALNAPPTAARLTEAPQFAMSALKSRMLIAPSFWISMSFACADFMGSSVDKAGVWVGPAVEPQPPPPPPLDATTGAGVTGAVACRQSV